MTHAELMTLEYIEIPNKLERVSRRESAGTRTQSRTLVIFIHWRTQNGPERRVYDKKCVCPIGRSEPGGLASHLSGVISRAHVRPFI